MENENNEITIDEKLYGKNLFGEPIKPNTRGIIADKFLVPPFTVLSARDGFWQDRKRMWISLGIKSECGREGLGVTCNGSEGLEGCEYMSGRGGTDGGSIFDPVIAELFYNWFCPEGGQILDPFAGGSVRGIVASILGFKYHGIDLSYAQIDANREQARAICESPLPEWMVGDSMELLAAAPESDFIFSCPPYGDLEVYSDDPKDLSNMEFHTFIAAYKRIILKACMRLKENRFACFVVGDFRDGKGFYRNFVGETVQAFIDCGLQLYNEAILITSVGSLPVRITRQFEAGRKLGKTHQNILVFVKGDPKLATQAINKTIKVKW